MEDAWTKGEELEMLCFKVGRLLRWLIWQAQTRLKDATKPSLWLSVINEL
jgi:hypothetical protein